MHQPDGLARTGTDAQAAADASFPDYPVRIGALFDGSHLASFIRTYSAGAAFFRIDFGIIIGIDNH